MSFGLLDDKFWRNPKQLAMSPHSRGLYIIAISYCHDRAKPNPFLTVSEAQMLCRMIDAPRRAIEELASPLPPNDCPAWERVDGGYLIHGWNEYQRASFKERRDQQNRERQQRWRDRQKELNGVTGVTKPVTVSVTGNPGGNVTGGVTDGVIRNDFSRAGRSPSTQVPDKYLGTGEPVPKESFSSKALRVQNPARADKQQPPEPSDTGVGQGSKDPSTNGTGPLHLSPSSRPVGSEHPLVVAVIRGWETVVGRPLSGIDRSAVMSLPACCSRVTPEQAVGTLQRVVDEYRPKGGIKHFTPVLMALERLDHDLADHDVCVRQPLGAGPGDILRLVQEQADRIGRGGGKAHQQHLA